MKVLYTVLSPRLLDLYTVENAIVVIIDVFRATSTIATALHNGAAKIIPVAEVDECLRLGKILNAVTAGERNGKVIENLSNGNSPAEYTKEFIEGKTMVLTTTNGTKMLHLSLKIGADEIITGSFVNLDAVCRYLLQQNKNVILACSAWQDKFNIEDTLLAGAIIDAIGTNFSIHCDSSLMAQQLYQQHKNNLKDFVQKTTHWHRLASYGQEADMLYCISKNVANVLPYYDKNKNCLLLK